MSFDVCRRIELVELMIEPHGVMGKLYIGTLLRGQEASLRDKTGRD